MSPARLRGWRPRNVPVPEPHVGGLLVGGGLHLVRPWPLSSDRELAVLFGGALLVVGLTVVAWSVRAVGRRDLGDPGAVVTRGPYRYSRNPMYVGWTALYVGVTLAADTVWPLALLPLVAVAVHAAVRREERALERRFGDAYRAYRRDVRRYL